MTRVTPLYQHRNGGPAMVAVELCGPDASDSGRKHDRVTVPIEELDRVISELVSVANSRRPGIGTPIPTDAEVRAAGSKKPGLLGRIFGGSKS